MIKRSRPRSRVEKMKVKLNHKNGHLIRAIMNKSCKTETTMPTKMSEWLIEQMNALESGILDDKCRELILSFLTENVEDPHITAVFEKFKEIKKEKEDENLPELSCCRCFKEIKRDSEEHDETHINENQELICPDCMNGCDCESCLNMSESCFAAANRKEGK